MSIDSTVSPPAGPGADAIVTEAAGHGLFVRKSSGLVREIGFRDAFLVNLAIVNPAGAMFLLFAILTAFPGADPSWGFIVGALAVVTLAIVYSQLVAAMPRSGADYVFASRIFHPAFGAFVGLGLLVVLLYTGGTNAAVWAQQFVSLGFSGIGTALHWSWLIHASSSVASGTWAVVAAVVVIASGVGLALRGTRVLTRALFWCTVLGMVGFLAAIIAMLVNSGSSFRAAFDHAALVPNGYHAVLAQAKHAGYIPHLTAGDTLSALPFFALGYWGYTFSSMPGGELKRPGKTQLVASLGAMIVGAMVFIGSWLVVRHVGGLHFAQSSAWLSTNDPTAYGKITGLPANGTFFALLVTASPVFKIVISIGFILLSAVIVYAYVLIIARLIFALSFDRLLPTRLASVSRRSHVAIWAMVLNGIGMSVAAYFVIESTGLVSAFRNSVLVFAIVFLIASLGLTVLPWRRRDLYEASPKVIGGNIRGVPVLTLVGAVSAVINAIIGYLAATKTQISGGYDTTSVAALIAIGAVGPVVYGISRVYNRFKGLDLSLAMRDLPPE